MKYFDKIIADIREEREKQLQKWSYEHDAKHDIRDWMRIIANDATKLLNDDSRNNYRRFVQIAAVCVAAIETIISKNGGKDVR